MLQTVCQFSELPGSFSSFLQKKGRRQKLESCQEEEKGNWLDWKGDFGLCVPKHCCCLVPPSLVSLCLIYQPLGFSFQNSGYLLRIQKWYSHKQNHATFAAFHPNFHYNWMVSTDNNIEFFAVPQEFWSTHSALQQDGNSF